EDGIRDLYVTGVQTCALPIFDGDPLGMQGSAQFAFPNVLGGPGCDTLVNPGNVAHYIKTECFAVPNPTTTLGNVRRNSLVGPARSEERRVGKGCRPRWAAYTE